MLAVAQNHQFGVVAHIGQTDQVAQHARVLDVLAVHRQNDVPILQTGFLRRCVVVDLGDQYALGLIHLVVVGHRLVHFLGQNTQVGPLNLPVIFQGIDHLHGHLGGNRKADPLAAAALAQNGCVHAYELALHVHQGAPAVAGVDGGIGLDQVGIVHQIDIAAQTADDPHGHRLPHPERVADGHDLIAHPQGIAVPDGDRRQVLGVDLDQGHIRGRIGTDDLGHVFLLAVEIDHDLVGVLHHMVIGQDVPVGRDHHARAEGMLNLLAAPVVDIIVGHIEEPPENGVVKKRIDGIVIHDLVRGDIDHRGHGLGCHIGV